MVSRQWDLLVWEQARDLIEHAERIQRNLLQVVVGAHYHGPPSRLGTWVPPVNVVETERSWWVISALPGVQADQIEVRLEGNELIIAGSRPSPECCYEGKLQVWEIPLGRFERRLNLTPGVRFAVGDMRFEAGLLIMELRKIL